MIRRINEPAVEGLKPDLTILLKTDPAAMRKRRDASLEDRMDSQKLEFHREVLRGYLTLSQGAGALFVIDGERPVDEIAKAIRERVDRFVWK